MPKVINSAIIFFRFTLISVSTVKIKKKKKKHTHTHVNKIFTGVSRDFGGDFVYVFFLPHKEWPEENT